MKYGEAIVSEGRLRYVAGTVDSAVPRGPWDIPLNELKLVAEVTTPDGPIFDYFYVFVAGPSLHIYLIPSEALESRGPSEFFQRLELVLGSLHHSLAASTDYASSVMWPASHVGKQVFDFPASPPKSWWRRLLGQSETQFVPNETLIDILEGKPQWAA